MLHCDCGYLEHTLSDCIKLFTLTTLYYYHDYYDHWISDCLISKNILSNSIAIERMQEQKFVNDPGSAILTPSYSIYTEEIVCIFMTFVSKS